MAALAPHAPALLWSEFTATLRRHVWQGGMPVGVGAELLERFLSLPIGRAASDDLYRRAADIATQLGWKKTYDAEYIALAELFDVPLVTRDERMRRGAGHLVTVLTPIEALA